MILFFQQQIIQQGLYLFAVPFIGFIFVLLHSTVFYVQSKSSIVVEPIIFSRNNEILSQGW